MKQLWVQDTLQTVEEQDIWRELAIGIIDKVGPIPVIAFGMLLLILPTVGGVLGVLKFMRRSKS